MPSSPGPTDFKRTLQRFFYKGISLLPQDALPEGKVAWARNVRSYQDGTITPRYGLDQLTDDAFDDPIHSIFRLNDETPFADIGAPSRRILGSGTGLYGGTPGTDIYTLIDAVAYSGNPLTGVVAQPRSSPRPFLYIGDSVRMRKVNSSFNDYPIGIAQPLVPPTAQLAAPESTYLDLVGVAPWTTYGGQTTGFTVGTRVSTTVTALLYDSGTTGMASVGLADFENVTVGANLDIGAAPETVIVDAVLPAIVATTIAAILYDAGTTGLCTIQPTGSFSAGQIEKPLPADVARRYTDLNEPLPPRVTVTRTVDFPVGALVLIGGTEIVRIQSIAIGHDGVMSFRCFTFGTFAAGAALAGIPSLRAYFTTTKLVGDPVVEAEWSVTVTPTSATVSVVGGVQGPVSGPGRDWMRVGSQATQPEDIIRFGFKCSLLGFVESVRLVLNVSTNTVSPGTEFLKDYYFYEWRASDLITAIQATGESATGLVSDAQQAAVIAGQQDALYVEQYGQQPASGAVYTVDANGVPQLVTPPMATHTREDTGRTAQPRPGSTTDIAAAAPVSTGAGLSRQLALGNDAWMTLECRVSDLTRVGSDVTLTLSRVLDATVYAQMLGTLTPMTISVSDVYLVGGYGPDAGLTLAPYVYRYSYRSTITGERSNPSPPMRAGVTPRRGRVLIDMTPSLDPQTDVIDVWRFGGALARWAYVGTRDNDPAGSPALNQFTDDMADARIDGGERIRPDWFQPWPTSDLPRSGTCNVAGTAVEWVSGDTFNTDWSADSLIVINGTATQLYASPTSTTRLHVVDNCGSGTGVPFQLLSPTLLAQPLSALWGGPLKGAWLNFACGDPINPGALHWTHGNDPDATSDRNYLQVSTGAEPLMNGWFDDGTPYVFSSERLYRIVYTPGALSPVMVEDTNCTIGCWTPWFFCPDPQGGAYFGNKRGIFHMTGGGEAQSLTDPDLRVLFPQDGTDSEAIRNLAPIDFTETTRLRLAVVGRLLYFDYVDTDGEGHTLVYDPAVQGWTPDAYLDAGDPLVPTGVTVRLSEPGEQVYNHILALGDGHLYEYTLAKTTDVLEDINWAVWTPWVHGDDPRAHKQFGDAILDMNAGGSVNGILVTPVIDNGNVALAPVTLGAADTLRTTYLVELSDGVGTLSRNCGLWIEGAVQACDINRPLLYLWEASYLWKGTAVGYRATDWEDLGYKGAKFVQGVVIRANTFGEPKLVEVQYDGPLNAPQVALTLSLLHNGEQTIAYPVEDAGWNPFIAELVRLAGVDGAEWILHDWRFVWEPSPEAATQWETQPSTFDLPGYLTARDGVMAYAADTDVELVVTHDTNQITYALPSTLGEYARVYVPFQADKGKAVSFQWSSDLPLRIYKRDCSVRVQGWGIPGGYMIVNPFGGPHRADGAGI